MVVLAQNRVGRRVGVAPYPRLVGTELLAARHPADGIGHLASHAQAPVALDLRAVVLFTQQGEHPVGLETAVGDVEIARSANFELAPRHSLLDARIEPFEPGDKSGRVVAVEEVHDLVSPTQPLADERDGQTFAVVSLREMTTG